MGSHYEYGPMKSRQSLALVDQYGQPMRSNVVPFQKRRYDAASQAPRLSSWYTTGTDANAAINNPAVIRDRSRDLIRNNPWGNRALSVIVNSAVGYGIRAQIRDKSKSRVQKMQRLWEDWAESRACDADGQFDIYGLQQLAFRSMVESGEVIARLRPRRPEDNLPLPIQIQIIEPDLLVDTIQEGVAPGHTLVRGIEYDQIGRRVAYWLYRKHPGSNIPGEFQQTTRVPASEIVHLYRKDRPGQERGVPWLAPVAVTLRELAIYEDASLKRVQLSNLMCGFLISNNPEQFEAELEDQLPDLAPGTMYALRPGSHIEWSNPPSSGEDPAFRDSCLRRVAAGLGITYESLTGDLSQVNFSSARVGGMDFGRNIDSWLWATFIPTFCDGIFRWFLDAAEIQTGINTRQMVAEWTPPARVMVDPNKETTSLVAACKGGLISLPEAIRKQGYDPEMVAREQADYLTLLDSLGIKVESDFRQSAKTSAPDAPDTPDAPDSTDTSMEQIDV